MVKAKVLKLELSDGYMGRSEGCFELKHRDGSVERIPHFESEVSSATLKEGAYISISALIDLCLWDIPTVIETTGNRVAGFLLNPETQGHVKTRIAQYKALENGKGIEIARQLVLSKIEGQRKVLRKYGLLPIDPSIESHVERLEPSNLETFRRRITGLEGKASEHYFNQIFSLVPEKLRPNRRMTFKAYDGINNVFNFAYYALRCKVYEALIKAKLEPYLGFLHSIQFGKPSLVCDFQELYRPLIDDFLLERCVKLHKNDFVLVTDVMMRLKMGKRIHLCEYETNELADDLNKFFERMVEVPRIKVGKRQTLDTLISEEALLLAKFLRGERTSWVPRCPLL